MKRNEFLHKINSKQLRHENISRCHQQIEKIYAVDRQFLTDAEKALFKLPIEMRKMKGLDALSTWIAMAELTLTNAFERNGKKYGKCMFNTKNMGKYKKQKRVKTNTKKKITYPRNKRGK